jgi:hypothetical protein
MINKYWHGKHDEDIPAKHLTIDRISGDILLPIGIGKIHCDAQYIVSISALKDDIKDSVIRSPGGYLEDLRDSSDLQAKFVTAINQIYAIIHSIMILFFAIISFLISSNHRRG